MELIDFFEVLLVFQTKKYFNIIMLVNFISIGKFSPLIKEPINVNAAIQPAAQSTSSTPSPASSITNSAWPASAARYILDLPLLLLASNKFIRFQPPNKVKAVYLVEKEHMSLFSSETIQSSQFINPELPKDLLQILKKFDFQRKS